MKRKVKFIENNIDIYTQDMVNYSYICAYPVSMMRRAPVVSEKHSKKSISRITLALVLPVFLCFQGVLSSEDLPASSSYKIASHAFSSGSSDFLSSSYQLFSRIAQDASVLLSSEHFFASLGFPKTSFFMQILAGSILGIDPSYGKNIAPIHINRIIGLNFGTRMSVELKKSGESNIVATNVTVVSPSELNCDLNIVGAKAGKWDVLISKESEGASVLPNAFEIKSDAVDFGIAINYPNPFDPARESTTVTYRLTKNTDVAVYIFTITGDMIWSRQYFSGFQGGREGENAFAWDGLAAFGEMQSNGVYLLHVVERSLGRTLAKGKIAIVRR